MQTSCRVDENDVTTFCLRRLNGVEHDGSRVCAFTRTDDIDTSTSRPDLQLLDSSGAIGVGGTDEWMGSLGLQKIRQLSNGRGFARSVDANDQPYPRR